MFYCLSGRFKDLSDGSIPDKTMWEDGEPRNEYDCVVLSLQPDDSLKLKTINCKFQATYICSVRDEGTYGGGKLKEGIVNILRK